MLQPRVFVKSKNKVYDVEQIDFSGKTVEIYDEYYRSFEDSSIGFENYTFDEVEFMDNTGFEDKKGNYIYLGDIVEIVGTLFEVKYKIFKGYAIENKEYTLSLEANFDTATVIGNIYENKELLKNE